MVINTEFEVSVLVTVTDKNKQITEQNRPATFRVDAVSGVMQMSDAPTRSVIFLRSGQQIETLESKDMLEKKLRWMGKRP